MRLAATRIATHFSLFLACLAAGPAAAQWVHYPTPGLPRLPGGKPNLDGPAPKTADGKPDLSGIWEPERTRPCPPEGCADLPTSEQFFDIGWKLPGGLPYQPWARELKEQRRVNASLLDPHTRCLPIGPVRQHTMPLLRKIIQSPGLLVILNERNMEYRQIFTDGRPLPHDPQPSWSGYSVGHWEGDTLIVESAGFRDDLWLDRNGSPMTSAAKLTERFRRVKFGQLAIDVTVDDPKAYTKPWTARLNEFIVPDTEMLDYVCLENEKDRQHFVPAK
jgi:hypothetical protein